MTTPEIAASASRQHQDLIAAREWLGQPVFEDKRKGYGIAERLVSSTISVCLKDRRSAQWNVRNVLEDCRMNRSLITAASIASKSCLGMLEDMRRGLLLELTGGKKENRAIAIAALDVVKGSQIVLGAVELMYGSGHTLLANGDPKGFTFVKKQAEFWSSPLRMTDGSIKPYEVPELIGEGAKLGAKTYRRMHRIAEEVLRIPTRIPTPGVC